MKVRRHAAYGRRRRRTVATKLTDTQRTFGEFYVWLERRANYLRQQRAAAQQQAQAERREEEGAEPVQAG